MKSKNTNKKDSRKTIDRILSGIKSGLDNLSNELSGLGDRSNQVKRKLNYSYAEAY